MENLILADMTWEDVEATKHTMEVAILPIGSHEQHGPNQTYATDTARAYSFSKLLGERLFPRALVCPPIPVGVSHHHMGFAGTLTLRPKTLIDVIYDVATSLKQHGITQLVLINGHGGNRAALNVACTKLHYDLGIRAAWIGIMSDMGRDLILDWVTSDAWGHADEVEVSQSLYLAPEVVRADRLAPGVMVDPTYNNRTKSNHERVSMPQSFDSITANGALGDARLADLEFGKRLTETVLDRTVAFMEERFLAGNGRSS